MLAFKIMQAAHSADFTALETAIQLGMHNEDVLTGITAPILINTTSIWEVWRAENPHPSLFFEPPCLDLGLLEFAISYGQLKIAVSLAQAGADLTVDGAFCVRAWLADAVSSLRLFKPVASKQKVYSIAMAVMDVQSERNMREALKATALPLLQALGGVARVRGRVELRTLPVAGMICEFLARRAALMDLRKDDLPFAVEGSAHDQVLLDLPRDVRQGGPPSDVADVWPAKQADDETDLQQALVLSEAEAEQEEGSQVAAALLQSKADAPPLSGDDAVVFRLTRVLQGILQALLEAPQLAEVRARVTEAGCELRQEFLNPPSKSLAMAPVTSLKRASSIGFCCLCFLVV